MPYFLLGIGFLLFIFSVLMLFVPALSQLDLQIVVWMSQQHSSTLNIISSTLSTVGGMLFVLFLTTIWCLYQVWYKKYQHVVFIALGLVGSIAIVWLLKYLVSRPRPPEMYHLVESYGASFPSAHSMYAATLGCLPIYLSRKHPQHHIIWFCAVLWLVIMGLSRVYLGVHFPSDVLAGWSISFIWISLLYLGYAKFSRAKTN